MSMNYEKEILRILYEAGKDGLSVHKIAIHVHNAHNTLFSPIAFEKVRLYVQIWLLRNSKSSDSLVAHCEKRGMYRINIHSSYAIQTIMKFNDNTTEQPFSTQEKGDKQLHLFETRDE